MTALVVEHLDQSGHGVQLDEVPCVLRRARRDVRERPGGFGSKLAAFKDMVTRRRDSKTQSLMDALSESGSARTERVLSNVLTRTRVY